MKQSTAKRIHEALQLRGMKQSDLVSKTGIGKSSISTYISGAYEPKQTNIYKIAKALNVNESWLMGYDVPMEKPSFYNIQQKKDFSLIEEEKNLISKYQELDDKGRHTVNTVLDMEHNRCTNDHLIPIAAHNDNITDEQYYLIQQDLKDMDENW